MTLGELVTEVDRLIPFVGAADWDPVGLQFGDPLASAGTVGVCHEITPAVANEVVADGIDTLISYHPLLFRPTTTLVAGPSATGTAFELIRGGVSVIVVHTAFDVVAGGAADALAATLDVQNGDPFVLGDDEIAIGRIGDVARQSLGEASERLVLALGASAVRVAGDPAQFVDRCAFVPGSGGNAVAAAAALGADLLVTGDVSHHAAAQAKTLGVAVIDVGHAPSERPGMARLVEQIRNVVPSAVDLTEINTDPWEH